MKPESAPGRAQYDGRLGAKEGPVEGVGEFTNILDKVYRNIYVVFKLGKTKKYSSRT